jgi:hypothetical protein
VFALASAILSSALFAQEVDVGRSLKLAFFLAAAVLVVRAAEDARAVHVATKGLAISSAAVFAYGAYGFFTGNVGDPIEHGFGYFGVTYAAATRNGDVLYFQTAFWVAVSLFMHARGTVGRVLAGSMTVAVGAGLAMSLARGTWVSTALALAFVSWRCGFLRRRRQAIWIGASALAACLVVAGLVAPAESANGGEHTLTAAFGRLAQRAETLLTMADREGGNSNSIRVALVARALEIASEYPFGVGVGNAREHLVGIGDGDLNHVENEYLQLLVEQGLLAVAGLVLLLYGTIAAGVRRCQEAQIRSERPWVGWALVGMLVDVSIYGMFNILHESTWFWLVLALAAAWARCCAAQAVVPGYSPVCRKELHGDHWRAPAL